LLLFLSCLLLSEGGRGRRGAGGGGGARLAVGKGATRRGKTFTFSYDAPPAPPPAPPPTTDAQPDQRRRKKSLFGGTWIARVTRNRHRRLSFPVSTHVLAPLDPPQPERMEKGSNKTIVSVLPYFCWHYCNTLACKPFSPLSLSVALSTTPDFPFSRPFLRVPACSCLCQITVHTQPPRGTIYLSATLTLEEAFTSLLLGRHAVAGLFL